MRGTATARASIGAGTRAAAAQRRCVGYLKPTLSTNSLASFSVLCDFSQRQGVDDQLSKARYGGIQFNPFLHGIFVVGLGIHALRLIGHEILEQLDGFFAIRRVLGNRCPGYIDVGASALGAGERRPYHLDGFPPLVCIGTRFSILHTTNVVGVGDADVADPAQNVARNVAIPAGRFTRQIIFRLRNQSSVASNPLCAIMAAISAVL